jgi:hypothetical protein
MSRHRQTSTLALVGRCLVAYVIVATAFYWLIEPIRGKSYAALMAMPKPAATDQQPIAKADRLRPGLDLPSATGLPAARAAAALQDVPEGSVISRPVKKAHRPQDASGRVAQEQPAHQAAPPGFGWGSANGNW